MEPWLSDSRRTAGPDILIRVVCGRRSRLIALAASTTTSSRTAARSGHGRSLSQAAAAPNMARMPTGTAAPRAGPMAQPSAPGPEKTRSDVMNDIREPGFRLALSAQPRPQAVILAVQKSGKCPAPALVGARPAALEPVAKHHVQLLHSPAAAPAQPGQFAGIRIGRTHCARLVRRCGAPASFS